ncbi:MAG: tRNA pseudouridine(55) synthase TruB [Alphaproteobacteria bacterium]
MSNRRRPDRPIHGWLVIDKPKGTTSARVVARVRRLTGATKAGHGGTLDPLASGVLPIALGEATKTVAYVMDGTKAYRFTVRWGEARDTDDADGEVTAESPVRPGEAEIRAELARFLGEIEQIPPTYSAVKVEGQRAYALARANESFALAPRVVRIDLIELVCMDDDDHATFEVECGKGTYMRALARDLGQSLGAFAHIVALRRTAVGPFTEGQAISLDSVGALGHSAGAFEHLLPIETALVDIPALALTETEARWLRSGRPVPMLRASDVERIDGLHPGTSVCAMSSGKPVAVARFDKGKLRPVRVFNL